MNFLFVPETMPYGKERRKLIKDWFTANPDGQFSVNCRYRPQVKNDPDLKKLIRTGFLKQVRTRRPGVFYVSKMHGVSYLVKT